MRLTRTVLSVVLGLTTACMAAGTCRLAHAQATRLVSAFTAPESCPNAREFQQAVERLLGGELPQQIPSIDVRAVRVGDGYSVHSTARFADGTGGSGSFATRSVAWRLKRPLSSPP